MEIKVKILCHFNHFFGRGSALVGKSTVGKAEERHRAVQTALTAIRALPFDVEVRVCGFPASALVPIDLDLTEIRDPMFIVYESIERMFGDLNEYDYFLNIEDDVLLGMDMVQNCIGFNSCSNLNEVYLPNRMERGADDSLYCVDLLAVSGWRKALCRTYQNTTLGVANNHHSALFFLSREQMQYAAGRVNLSRRDLIFSGFMASAYANVHSPFLLWRARSDLLAHHVTHLDNWLHSPSNSKPLTTRVFELVPQEDTRKPLAVVDEVVLDGAFVKIRGWAVNVAGDAARQLAVSVDGYETTAENCRVTRVDRPDVVSVHPHAQLDCGFELAIPAHNLFGLQDNPDSLRATLSFRSGLDKESSTVESDVLSRGLRSVLEALPKIPDSAHMPEAEATRLSELMQQATCFLAYGAGGATLQAVALRVPTVITVEGDAIRLESLRYRIAKTASSTTCHLRHADIGWRSNSHDRASDAYWRSYDQIPLNVWQYPLDVWRFCQAEGITPDLILIDGQFSLACLLASILFATPGCRIIVPNYFEWPHDAELQQLVGPARIVGRASEFVVSEGMLQDRDATWRMVLRALADTRYGCQHASPIGYFLPQKMNHR